MGASAPLDTLSMFDAAAGLAEQIEVAVAAGNAPDNLPSADGITSVVVLGMGGSGIAGDLLAAVAGPKLSVPVIVPKGYNAPAFVGPNTLVFAVSFSGNTEETVEAATQAAEAGARMVLICAGGQLKEHVSEWNAAHVPVDDSIPMPRAGIGAVAIPPMVILERMGMIDGMTDEILGAVEQLRKRREEVTTEGSFAEVLARRVGRTMPLIYGGGLIGEVAAMRWKGQFNENPKVPSFFNRIPELTHNEICGWGQHGDMTRQVFTMLLLRHDYEHPQTARRFEMVGDICEEIVASVHHIKAAGDSPLAQMLDLIMIGDFVTIYAAYQAEVDPGPVPILDYLKTALKR